MFPCDSCTATFTRKSNLVRHNNEIHFQIPQRHYTQSHGPHIDCASNLPRITENNISRIICNTAFNNSIRTIRFIPDIHLLPEDFLMLTTPLIKTTIQTLLKENQPLKISCSLSVTFTNGDKNDESYFSMKAQPICIIDIETIIQSLNAQVEAFTKRGSQWKITKTNFFQMNVVLYKTI